MKRNMKWVIATTATEAAVLVADCSSSGASTTSLNLSNDKPIFTSGYQAVSKVLSQQLHLSLNINPYAAIPAFDTAIRSGAAADRCRCSRRTRWPASAGRRAGRRPPRRSPRGASPVPPHSGAVNCPAA